MRQIQNPAQISDSEGEKTSLNEHVATYFSLPRDAKFEIHDLRYLEAPEPMQWILMKGVQLKADDYFMARLPHVPSPLFPHLESRGLDWQVLEEDDGSAVVMIRRKT